MKTLTVTFEDALLSPIGFSILSGAGLFKGHYSNEKDGKVHFHMNSLAVIDSDGNIDMSEAIAEFGDGVTICTSDAPVYVMGVEDDGSVTGEIIGSGTQVTSTTTPASGSTPAKTELTIDGYNGIQQNVMVDYYIDLDGDSVYEADITQDTFAGYYYVEAETLFRDQETGKDMPANLTYPNVKLQSNFTITMASSGDPSGQMRKAA